MEDVQETSQATAESVTQQTDRFASSWYQVLPQPYQIRESNSLQAPLHLLCTWLNHQQEGEPQP